MDGYGDDGRPYIIASGAFGEDDQRVPLVIYFGEERHVIGEAIVRRDGTAEVSVNSNAGPDLAELLQSGAVRGVCFSVHPDIPPPVYRDGTIRWERDYLSEEAE